MPVESAFPPEPEPAFGAQEPVEEKPFAPPVGIFESYNPAPVQWGTNEEVSEVVAEPEIPSSPFSAPSVFQPVYDEPAVESAPEPEPAPFSAPPAWGSPVFEPVAPSTASAPQEPAAPEADPSKEEGDRVDDLLRQFRERYGR